MVQDGPFKNSLENLEGIIFQELRSYKIKDGVVTIEVATRNYFKNGDYNDTINYKPISHLMTKEALCSYK